VEVSQRSVIHVGDVVQIEEPTEELLNILDGLVLPSAKTISATEISSVIKSEMESSGSLKRLNVTFRIPTELQIKKSSTPISKIEVERKVTNILKSRCVDCAYKVNVQSAPYPAGTAWDLDYSQINGKGSFLIPVRDGDARAMKWISGTVRVTKLTPVATRFIQLGERIQTGDLKMSLVDVTFAKDAPVRIQDIQGQQLTKSLQIGQPLWSSDIKREVATQRGQMVKATLGNGDFEITANLEAQDNAFIGDTIKVKNLETQKTLSALVTEKGVVKIQ
jgi:flagella basal body P-ring formation protein FlgA